MVQKPAAFKFFINILQSEQSRDPAKQMTLLVKRVRGSENFLISRRPQVPWFGGPVVEEGKRPLIYYELLIRFSKTRGRYWG
jgi:hypothetical protein